MMSPPITLPSTERTPTKRPRKEGVAVTEFRASASLVKSDYSMWSHCLNGAADSSLVCYKPLASLRLHISSAQLVVGPHLFSAQAIVAEVLLDDEPLLEVGQSVEVLLSFAVCADAVPRIAKPMMSKVEALKDTSNDINPTCTGEQLAVEVHRPWRIQGQGDDMCLLISRFVIL